MKHRHGPNLHRARRLTAVVGAVLILAMPTVAVAAGSSYRPFLDPIGSGRWWWFLMLPLVVGISVVYKAIRLPTLNHYWAQVLKMIAQIMAAMVAMAVGLYIVVQVVLPMM
ncbi:MAG: hypothetical protein D8M59_05960 [Planctomycetes bacterium]|nr:hypothetical protein [Planctomycetota bacterium]NOG55871.1 hypothetical protein [Planctomycetota bacterium]